MCSFSTISFSLARSASVTRSTSPLYSVRTPRSWKSWSSNPASSAIAAAGTASPRFSESGNWLITARLPLFLRCTMRRIVLRRAPSLLCNRADLLLIDEQVWLSFARQPDHPLVEVFDPAGDALSVPQLPRNRDLVG